ncbi:unnamed protein product [Orchesella dallaii]|uniref:Tctex1 domain-containing protein 2 n=1 Tax=Orchesella dallaii TaxID=48710 RepID=A0ABP1RYM1_9HEXA
MASADRSSVERDSREKSHSQSVERSLSAKKPVPVELEDNSDIAKALSQFDLDGFQIRPKFTERFSNVAVEQMIEVTLKEFFQGERKQYLPEQADEWVTEIGRILTGKMQTEFNYPRYKFVTYVLIGEKIGGGIHVGMKCLWDSDSDSYATYTFISDYLFCVATICAVFYY